MRILIGGVLFAIIVVTLIDVSVGAWWLKMQFRRHKRTSERVIDCTRFVVATVACLAVGVLW